MEKKVVILVSLLLLLNLVGCSFRKDDGYDEKYSVKIYNEEQLIENRELDSAKIIDGNFKLEIDFEVKEPVKKEVRISLDYKPAMMKISGAETNSYEIELIQSGTAIIPFQIDKAKLHSCNKMIVELLDTNYTDTEKIKFNHKFIYNIKNNHVWDKSDYEYKTFKSISDNNRDIASLEGDISLDEILEIRANFPSKIAVNSNEELQINMTFTNYIDKGEYLYYVTINNDLINIENPIRLISIDDDTKIINDKFNIKTPIEPGIYRIDGYIVKDPSSETAEISQVKPLYIEVR